MGMLLLSTAASVTGTVAWFSMNNSVTASGMQLKVKADDGILISTSAKSSWTDSAAITHGPAVLYPTSAAAVAAPAFVTANSTNADDAQASQTTDKYKALVLAWEDATKGEGVGFVDAGETPNSTFDDGESAYVLRTKYYIKSSGGVIERQDSETLLFISDVTASGGTNKVDNSLRVLVTVGTDAYVYAPIQGVASGVASLSYTWKGTTPVTAKGPTAYDQALTNLTTIGNTDATAVEVNVYCYFEGEDANCKSTNISGITMQNLAVTVHFASVAKH